MLVRLRVALACALACAFAFAVSAPITAAQDATPQGTPSADSSDSPDSPDPAGPATGAAGTPEISLGDVEGTKGREDMWWAPTAEDWARPCLIPFQRSWDDAATVSKETGKPILVCVNMDGEIASEHYAGVRYRMPEVAKLYEPYVCVIASVYRHGPRDYDEQGERILCPRFGSVTCGEHITMEPKVYEQFLDETRVSPRHIAVELDGEEMYDVYYAFDTRSVFTRIVEGVANRPPPRPPRGDRTLAERVASRDIADREAVEQAYREGDAAARRELLQAAQATGEDAPVDLLRLAIFGLDTDLSRLARRSLCKSRTDGTMQLINEALRVPLDGGEREELIRALERLGGQSPDARTYAVVHRGLGTRSRAVDVEAWAGAIQAQPTPPADRQRLETLIEEQDAILGSGDVARHLDLADAFLTFAYEQYESDPEFAEFLLMDARRTAREASRLGAYGWRANAALAVSEYYLGEAERAHDHAEKAVAAGVPDDPSGWTSMAVLAIFAQARQQDIREAAEARQPWPPEWLTDVHAACSVLARHPLSTPDQLVAHYDFLDGLGGAGQASRVLDQALERFPDSFEVHGRLRRRVLRESGVDGLEPAYEAMLARGDAAAPLHWYAGYASFVTAEYRRRTGHEAAALAAYDRAIAHHEADVARDPARAAAADEQIALALAGRARLAYERGEDDVALTELLAAFARGPEAAATQDGLNISAVDTAMVLLARLEDRGSAEAAGRLAAALGALDPKMLEMPAYEPTGPDGRARMRRLPGSGRREPPPRNQD